MKLPKGFLASGVRAGIRKKRPDLGLIVAEDGANAAAVFTKNRFQAAPVVLSKAALKKTGGRAKAIVVNAGCANAVTGREGLDAAKRVRTRAAELLHCGEEEILLASTGVIGVVLPDKKIRESLPDAVTRLSIGGGEGLSHAILTTDVGPKVAQATFTLGGKRGRLVGVAKGAGMIHPNMATMLGFVMTDAALEPAALQRALRAAVDQSFNVISVDGDTSTNDTVFLLASGKLGNDEGADLADFQRALNTLCRDLAWMIVRDGEGATRVMELEVTGARSEREAKLAAHAIATSPLVKTALHGGDPNWGRILAAAGRSGARFSVKRVSLTAGSLPLVRDGQPVVYREKDAAKIFARERVPLHVDLGAGSGRAVILSSDLGHDYVSLNADYRS
ncbi:MAG: bifunctional glutamate N-acetyltransferase/amino-acid acetyltransferase ArgJ [Acidobacteria bacterium]|nr:bifunctional glutamate N-acetyltransferase/amino-acid acetyltransferase ArgJ [Acidobacteriota bacterium]MBV9475620.1 bifunctional glutamate N-acetyltransferase/amino-acid acetyltransferase ArgJ [Acidobacteriota bacterium]